MGDKRIADVNIGDYLYDAENRPVLCIGVAPPEVGRMKEIKYQDFDSRQSVTFKHLERETSHLHLDILSDMFEQRSTAVDEELEKRRGTIL
ncbi:hypothetical protein W97_00937 [Coniosporium apollinis CBS 100218]|uniref:Uncharacterized protein n=1 Tax=Coniosporium apollinis (strain CBS 100218) TaxID=1168221 RepID=R7YJB9_CONA1|nr:uncharacterized protein W97_00937 [Coniosporium apollinis CBS 100218]EON61721.1 hypothetical protein W97_00937 [Coniosporium apollinis CBS 100218]